MPKVRHVVRLSMKIVWRALSSAMELANAFKSIKKVVSSVLTWRNSGFYIF